MHILTHGSRRAVGTNERTNERTNHCNYRIEYQQHSTRLYNYLNLRCLRQATHCTLRVSNSSLFRHTQEKELSPPASSTKRIGHAMKKGNQQGALVEQIIIKSPNENQAKKKRCKTSKESIKILPARFINSRPSKPSCHHPTLHHRRKQKTRMKQKLDSVDQRKRLFGVGLACFEDHTNNNNNNNNNNIIIIIIISQ